MMPGRVSNLRSLMSPATALPTVQEPLTKPVLGNPWRSVVEGDEQLDRPNSQTTMELCVA